MSSSIAPRCIRLKRVPVTLKMWPDIRLLWSEMVGVMSRHRWKMAAATVIVVGLVFAFLVPRDAEVLKVVQLKQMPNRELRQDLKELSGEIGKWGDFGGYNLVLVIGVWMAGRLFKSRYFQRLAVASMLCAVFAGLVANVFRFSVGRPRPNAIAKKGVADGWYGPQVKWDFNSFPSGHTATAFGSSIPLAVAMPVVGVPALLCATSVCWARMYGNQHHPSDVAVAIWIAVLFGVPLGLAVRRSRFKKAAGDPEDAVVSEDDEDEVVEAGEARVG
ncbi:phosphatase PAP2 family protein [Verrucomicrobium sp. BvORR034]|uniref:phosphatase PAP2 family protein n=1 Tax=Verrucomicrobium sp. BvORR034 TaxID=1396418 RepID=UPI000678BBB7|nr:phosphatase PAP2 family protein [Verrucomicrobium sp. BvORR034]